MLLCDVYFVYLIEVGVDVLYCICYGLCCVNLKLVCGK